MALGSRASVKCTVPAVMSAGRLCAVRRTHNKAPELVRVTREAFPAGLRPKMRSNWPVHGVVMVGENIPGKARKAGISSTQGDSVKLSRKGSSGAQASLALGEAPS